jgi:hypothetical protein
MRYQWDSRPGASLGTILFLSGPCSGSRALRHSSQQVDGKGYIMATKRLTLQQRREIFRDLVAAQDQGMVVRRSYQIVTERFEISEAQLRQIEDEGLEKEWPPLNEAMQEVG